LRVPLDQVRGHAAFHARFGQRLALLQREQRGNVLSAFAHADHGPLQPGAALVRRNLPPRLKAAPG
jgi:hypothetical protein